MTSTAVSSRNWADDLSDLVDLPHAFLSGLFANAPAAVAYFEGTPLELRFANDLFLQNCAGDDGVSALIEQVQADGEPILRNEFPIERAETRYYCFFAQPVRTALGAVRGVISFVFDMTDLVKSRIRFEAQSALTRTITENTNACLFLLDERGHATYMNDSARRVTGYELTDLSRRPLHEAIRCGIVATKQVDQESEFIRKDGTAFPVLYSMSPVMRDGKLIAGVLEFRDIGEKKRAELENARLYLEAQQAIQLRDEFLSIASHELKTPLTSLTLQAQMRTRAMSGGDLRGISPDKLNKMFEADERQLRRLSHLIDEMLDATRIQAGRLVLDRESTDLRALVEETVERFSHQVATARCTVSVRAAGLPDEAFHGFWDRHRLEQVVTNLLTNAMKYGPAKPIDIELSKPDSTHLRLTIRDQGRGIARDQHERIFERFERVEPSRGVTGLGLGLYIVRQIVESHGGRIWLESEPGCGAAFFVDLPVGD